MRNTLLTIGLILLIALMVGVGGYLAFRELTTSVVNPVQAANQNIQTQVAQVLHPTATIMPDPVTIINAVRPLARLETIHYTVEKVITAEIGQEVLGDLFGDRLLFIAHGVVIAGVDLSALSSQDITLSDGRVEIDLPDPEIFVATLDNQKSSVYDRQTGLFRQGDPELETLARQAAEEAIYQTAIEDDILQKANDNAELFLAQLLDDLGFEEVLFVPYEPPATPEPLLTLIPETAP